MPASPIALSQRRGPLMPASRGTRPHVSARGVCTMTAAILLACAVLSSIGGIVGPDIVMQAGTIQDMQPAASSTPGGGYGRLTLAGESTIYILTWSWFTPQLGQDALTPGRKVTLWYTLTREGTGQVVALRLDAAQGGESAMYTTTVYSHPQGVRANDAAAAAMLGALALVIVLAGRFLPAEPRARRA